MRSPEYSNRPLRAEEAAQRVCRVGRLGEGADEEHIESTWQLIEQVLKTDIANERDVVPQLSAPNPDYLRHDAGKIGIHDASVQSSRWALGDDIDDANTEFLHV